MARGCTRFETPKGDDYRAKQCVEAPDEHDIALGKFEGEPTEPRISHMSHYGACDMCMCVCHMHQYASACALFRAQLGRAARADGEDEVWGASEAARGQARRSRGHAASSQAAQAQAVQPALPRRSATHRQPARRGDCRGARAREDHRANAQGCGGRRDPLPHQLCRGPPRHQPGRGRRAGRRRAGRKERLARLHGAGHRPGERARALRDQGAQAATPAAHRRHQARRHRAGPRLARGPSSHSHRSTSSERGRRRRRPPATDRGGGRGRRRRGPLDRRPRRPERLGPGQQRRPRRPAARATTQGRRRLGRGGGGGAAGGAVRRPAGRLAALEVGLRRRVRPLPGMRRVHRRPP